MSVLSWLITFGLLLSLSALCLAAIMSNAGHDPRELDDVPPIEESPFWNKTTPHKYTPPRPSKKIKDRLALPPNTERESYRHG